MNPKELHEKRFFDCPGAWTGFLPGHEDVGDPNQGHITINPKLLLPKSRAKIGLIAEWRTKTRSSSSTPRTITTR